MAKIKMDKLKQHSVFITLIIAYLILFLPFVGTVPLFDWDEINFAEAAREMIVTGDWLNVQIGFEPFWEKPPLFIWLQAICMTLVGVNEFAARLPNVLIGLITLVVLYATLLKRYGKQAGIFSVLFYLGSFTSHFYFKSGIIDPLFNLLIFGSIIHLVKSVETQKRTYFFYAGLWLGLAVLTKGPTALLLVGLTGLFYQLIYRINFYAFKDILLLILGFFLVTGLYFGVQIAHMGTWFLREFIVYQVDLFRYPIASHGQPFYYHLVVLLIGCFPMFILALPGLLGKQNVSGDSTYYRWLKVLFWVVLIVFSMVTTKIVHYSSLCYLPIAAVSGIWLSRYEGISGIIKFLLALVGLIWVVLLSVLGLLALIPEQLIAWVSPYIKDDFALAQIRSITDWNWIPLILGIVMALTILKVVSKPSKLAISQLLVIQMLLITLLLSSVVPAIEYNIQGKWKAKLATYQGVKMAHFTYGFKSYAHFYYTSHQDLNELREVKQQLLAQKKILSITELDQFKKNEFDNEVRDFVIHHTNIPVSVSAKVQKFEEMGNNYPELTMVFEGNGYGIWERNAPK